MLKKLFYTQTLVLFGGSIFAWYTVYTDFVRFYGIEGTVFKIKDCALPNPVTTPCFWGAFAFIIALSWSIYILRLSDANLQAKQQSRLNWLLIASTLFAWGNFFYTAIPFWLRGNTPGVGCSGLLMTNPFTTPCFGGSVFFLIALIISLILIKKKYNAH